MKQELTLKELTQSAKGQLDILTVKSTLNPSSCAEDYAVLVFDSSH